MDRLLENYKNAGGTIPESADGQEKLIRTIKLRANRISRAVGYGPATSITFGAVDAFISHTPYGYRKNSNGEYVPRAYLGNFGWKNTYYQHSENEVQLAVDPSSEAVHYMWKQVAYCPLIGMVSVYDGSPWAIGETRIEAAQPKHQGGLYCFEFREMAEKAPFPEVAKLGKAPKRTVKVRVAGPYVAYGHKLAFSEMTPVEIC